MAKARYLFTGFITTLVAALAMPLAAQAAPGQSVTISPTSVDETIDPGETKSGDIQVINTGSQAFDFKVYATPYSVTGETYQQHFVALPGKPDIASWFKFPLTTAHIKPGQTVKVAYNIQVPANTPPGGYYATVFAETQPGANPPGTGVTVHQRVGTIFYLQVGGNAVKKGSLDSWQAKFWQIQPLTATVKVKNDGDTHFVADTHVVVRDIFGTPKLNLTTAREVLPRTIRQIDATWTKSPPIGLFKVSGTVKLLGQTHTLPTKYVLVVTWPVRLGIAAVILAVIVYLVTRRRRHAQAKD